MVLFFLAGLAVAAPPIRHQGRITDALGTPISGPVELTITLHSASSGGEVLWTHDASSTLNDGYYAATLGDDSSEWDAVFDEAEVWMQVSGASGPIGEPQPLVGVPYALRSVQAERLVDDPTLTGTVTVTDGTITGLPMPATDSDAASKAYVDQQVAGATTRAEEMFWWASVNLGSGIYSEQRGGTETLSVPGSNGVACSSGNGVCVHNHGDSYFTISFDVPTLVVDAQRNAPDGSVPGNLMCWATASGDNEPGLRDYGTMVAAYGGDINGGHGHCNTDGVSLFDNAGGTTCLGIRTTSAYALSDTSYGVVCVR